MEIQYLGVRGSGEKKMSPKDKKIKKRLDKITKELLDRYCGKKFFNLLAEDN
jgi:50S ribosomal subunit-associated GTPase HflX